MSRSAQTLVEEIEQEIQELKKSYQEAFNDWKIGKLSNTEWEALKGDLKRDIERAEIGLGELEEESYEEEKARERDREWEARYREGVDLHSGEF